MGSNSRLPSKYVGKVFGGMCLCKDLKLFPWKCTLKKTLNVKMNKIIEKEILTRHRIFSFKNGFMIEYTVYKYSGSLIKWNAWNLNGKLSLKNGIILLIILMRITIIIIKKYGFKGNSQCV